MTKSWEMQSDVSSGSPERQPKDIQASVMTSRQAQEHGTSIIEPVIKVSAPLTSPLPTGNQKGSETTVQKVGK